MHEEGCGSRVDRAPLKLPGLRLDVQAHLDAARPASTQDWAQEHPGLAS